MGPRPLAPLFPEIGVIGMVPTRWDSSWSSRHFVLSRLSQYFQVVWMNPAHGVRDLLNKGKIVHRKQEFSPVPGLRVYTPEPWLPRVHGFSWVGSQTFRRRLQRARSLLTSRGATKVVLYLWRPEFAPALDALQHELSCYHIDDEYSFSDVELPIADPEERLIGAVDQVFITSQAMLEKKGGINRRTSVVPNGVDYRSYAESHPEPDDLAGIPHPRIGYTGRLKRVLNWPLLLELSARHPEWHFVLIGPKAPHPEIEAPLAELEQRANVHILPGKSVKDLAAYPQYFDACLMPYVENDYTKYIYPMKLHEFLASGTPVIGAPIPALREFQGFIELASTTDEWSAAIARCLDPMQNGADERAMRQSIARHHDWALLASRIAATLAHRLGREVSDRFTAITGERIDRREGERRHFERQTSELV
ncbi:MAG: glycosyltransferase [Gemmatimonadota bacterium]